MRKETKERHIFDSNGVEIKAGDTVTIMKVGDVQLVAARVVKPVSQKVGSNSLWVSHPSYDKPVSIPRLKNWGYIVTKTADQEKKFVQASKPTTEEREVHHNRPSIVKPVDNTADKRSFGESSESCFQRAGGAAPAGRIGTSPEALERAKRARERKAKIDRESLLGGILVVVGVLALIAIVVLESTGA